MAKDYSADYKEINKLIDSNRFTDAVRLMQKNISGARNPLASGILHDAQSSYDLMADYLFKGFPDPSRETIYSDIREKLFSVNDSIMREALSADSPLFYYETIRNLKAVPVNFNNALSRYLDFDSQCTLGMAAGADIKYSLQQREGALSDMFRIIFTSHLDTPLASSLKTILLNRNYSLQLRQTLLCAAILNLLQYYSSPLLSILADVYEQTSEPALIARALTGILFTINTHPERFRNDLFLCNRLTLWNDNLLIYTHLREVVRQVVRSSDTDRIAEKMQHEIIPEIMKLRPDILKKMRDTSSFTDVSEFENNPEWEDMLEKNGIARKLRELSELQSEGSDVMMMAFSNLKNFPFFHDATNWFIPFSLSHSALNEICNEEFSAVNQILSLDSGFCDSDKFSFALALKTMPQQQRDMVMSQMDAQMAQMEEMMKDNILKSSAPEFTRELTKFLKDLYRFFRFFRRKNDFDNPFQKKFDFTNFPVFSEMLSDSEVVRIICEFYFKHKLYNEALPLLEFLEKSDGNDASYWEKRGLCLLTLADFNAARDSFMKAELLKEPSQWLLKQLCNVNFHLDNYKAALEYAERVSEKDPDNVSLILKCAACRLMMGKTKEALADYYHADYLRPDDELISAKIAWGETLEGNYDKALPYYTRLLSVENPAVGHIISAGHFHLLQNNIPKAVELYRRALNVADNNKETIRNIFLKESLFLSQAGISPLTIDIILDKL